MTTLADIENAVMAEKNARIAELELQLATMTAARDEACDIADEGNEEIAENCEDGENCEITRTRVVELRAVGKVVTP